MASAARKVAPIKKSVGPGSDDDFSFESSLGTITIPSLSKGPRPNDLAMAEAQQSGNATRMVLLVTKAKATPEVWEKLTSLPNDELEEFFTAWGAHSGITPGESQAS